jgi:hypothetical protein
MHFQGVELISRGTKLSARSVVVASFGILLTYYARDASDSTANIIGITLNVEQLKDAGALVVGFLLIGHLISWWGDMLSFRAWNVDKKTIRATWGESDLVGPIEKSIREIEQMERSLKELNGGANDQKVIDRLARDASEARKFLSSINDGLGRLNTFGWITIVGWYFIVPVLIGGTAVLKPEVIAMLAEANQSN